MGASVEGLPRGVDAPDQNYPGKRYGMIAHVYRPVVSLLALTLVCAALAACGSTGQPLSKTQAEAFAHAVNLRHSDVPGLRMSLSERQTKASPPFGYCITTNAGKIVLAVDSPWFGRSKGQWHFGPQVLPRAPAESVRSAVYVMSQSALATEYAGVVRNPDRAGCKRR